MVDCKCFRCCCRWTLAVASDFGICLVTKLAIKLGQYEKFPALISFTDVETKGINQATCIYDTNSCLFWATKALLADWWNMADVWTVGIECVYWQVVGGGTNGIGWSGDGLASGTVYRPILLSYGPIKMAWFSRVTLTWSAVQLTLNT